MKAKLACCLALMGLLVGTASAEIVAGFSPDPAETTPGGTVWVDIVADIPEDDAIVGWGLDLSVVDMGIAMWTGNVTIGDLWIPAAADGDDDGLAGISFDDVFGDDVLLASVEFQGVALGTTQAELGVTEGDLTEGFALFPTGFADFTLNPGTINVVPEPASLALLALAGLALRRR